MSYQCYTFAKTFQHLLPTKLLVLSMGTFSRETGNSLNITASPRPSIVRNIMNFKMSLLHAMWRCFTYSVLLRQCLLRQLPSAGHGQYLDTELSKSTVHLDVAPRTFNRGCDSDGAACTRIVEHSLGVLIHYGASKQ